MLTGGHGRRKLPKGDILWWNCTVARLSGKPMFFFCYSVLFMALQSAQAKSTANCGTGGLSSVVAEKRGTEAANLWRSIEST